MAQNKVVEQALEQGLRHHQAGELPQAEAFYRQVLQIEPRHADALHFLGLVALQVGQPKVAVDLIGQAVRESPFVANYYNSYGEALRALGKYEEAISSYRKALAREPNTVEVLSNMGLALHSMGKFAEAEAAFRHVIQINPQFADVYNNLGITLASLQRYEEAIVVHRRAVEINPQFAAGWNNFGVVLEFSGDLEGAIEAYTRATIFNPRQAPSFHNLGVPLVRLNRIAEAKAAWNKAVEIDPNYADAQFNLGLALLLEGHLEEGWPKHEWRWRAPSLQPPRPFPQPQWDGFDIAGKTILLHAEQGFGDTIQFIRYAPLVAQRGAKVVLEAQPELLDLMRCVPGISDFYSTNDRLPSFDCHIPLLSLPYVFQTTLSTIPSTFPYLSVPSEYSAKWQALVAHASTSDNSTHTTLKVGIAWRGRPTHKDDKNRSSSLALFNMLADIPNIAFYNLQLGTTPEELQQGSQGIALIDLTSHIKDFTDSAAFIEQLDLVISVDTSIVHLAGALAKPVWTLVPWSPDWRWMMERTDSPWYPAMRLFRQKKRADWPHVMLEIANELKSFKKEK